MNTNTNSNSQQSCSLKDKQCVPCKGGMPSLTYEQIETFLKETPDWKVLEDKKIEKEFKFKNFKESMSFVNKVAEIAEQEGHHPDIFLHNWNRVKISLTTFAVKGLSENDFILAAKIDEIK